MFKEALRGWNAKENEKSLILELNKKVNSKIGYDLISTIELNRLKNVTNYDDTEVRNLITALTTTVETQAETILTLKSAINDLSTKIDNLGVAIEE